MDKFDLTDQIDPADLSRATEKAAPTGKLPVPHREAGARAGSVCERRRADRVEPLPPSGRLNHLKTAQIRNSFRARNPLRANHLQTSIP